MADAYDTVSDVRRGTAVQLPTLSENEAFVLIKVSEEGGAVTLYNLTPQEAIDALMGVVMAIGGN